MSDDDLGDPPPDDEPVDLIAIAAAATGRPVTAAEALGRVAVRYDPFVAGRRVEVVTGGATVEGAGSVRWSAIVKSTVGTGLREARREVAAYRLGIASAGDATRLRAPQLLGWRVASDAVELWLERLPAEGSEWTLERFGVAAQDAGAWVGAWWGRPLPAGFEPHDAWAEWHGQPERIEAVLTEVDELRRQPSSAAVMEGLADPGFARTEAMIATTPWRIAQLATFPGTLVHHDLVRTNLFAVRDGTVAIDWELVGRGPCGVDMAPLVVGSVRRGEASAGDLPALEARVLRGYAGGLLAAGVPKPLVGAAAEAYRLALGLRWHVVLGTIRDALDPSVTRIRGSRPEESRTDALGHMVRLARHLLDAG